MMARYYFNLHNSIGFVRDEEGRELSDIETARAEAIRGARSVIAEDVLQGRLDLNGKIDVLDGDGALCLTIRFSDAVAVAPNPGPTGPHQ